MIGDEVELVTSVQTENGTLRKGKVGEITHEDERTLSADFYIEETYTWVSVDLKEGEYRVVEGE